MAAASTRDEYHCPLFRPRVRPSKRSIHMDHKRKLSGKSDGTESNGKMKAKRYGKELRKLQAELCILQAWVKHHGLRVIVIFEGRDGAGKGGTIRAITERVSPRVFRVVALPAPSDREKSQM